jgi:hypothetical protein
MMQERTSRLSIVLIAHSVAIGLLLVAVALLLVHSYHSTSVPRLRVAEVTIVDGHDRGRARFGMTGDGPTIEFLGEDGKLRLSVGSHPGGLWALTIRDGDDTLRVGVSAGNSDEPVVSLRDKRGVARLGLRLGDEEDASVEVFDAAGNLRAVLGSYETQGGAGAESSNRRESGLIVASSDGTVLWRIP